MNDYPLKKIQVYCKNPIQNSPVGLNLESEKTIYKRYTRILYYDFAFSKCDDGTDFSFQKECVADLSAAYLQFFLNLNKPSLMSLRSAIENSWRFLLSCNGVDPRDFDTVTGLVSEVRAQNLFSGMSTNYVNKGYDIYKDLCQAVHSSNADYLNNEIPFRSLTDYSKKACRQNIRKCDSVFLNVLCILFICKPNVIKSLESKSRDFVLDGIAKEVNRAVSL